MRSDRADFDAGHGVALEDALAVSIPLVGFLDGAADGIPLDDALAVSIPLVGFLDGGGDGDAANHADDRGQSRRGPSLFDAIRAGCAITGRLLADIRRLLVGSELRARRTRAAAMTLLALAVATGCWFGLRSRLAPRYVATKVAVAPIVLPMPAKSVLVARRAIPRGHILKRGDLDWRPWPAAGVKSDYIEMGSRPIKTFLGVVAREPLSEGEPIANAKIVSPGDRGFLAAVLQPGMRAISVAISPATAVSGLILPGDRVDILFTLPVPEIFQRGAGATAINRHSAETVLSGIRVVAIDQEIEGRDGKAMIGKTATLEVTPKQAEIVALADFMTIGKLSLSLHSLIPADDGRMSAAAPSHTIDADISKLFPPLASEEARPPATLTIVRPDQVSVLQATRPGS